MKTKIALIGFLAFAGCASTPAYNGLNPKQPNGSSRLQTPPVRLKLIK